MAAKIRVVQAALNTTTGNQDITLAGFGTPTACVVVVTPATTNGTAANDAFMSFGVATSSTNRWAGSVADEHGAATTDMYRSFYTDEVIDLKDEAGTQLVDADFVSFITDGIRINITTAPASAYLAMVLLIIATNQYANYFTLSTENTEVDVTDPTFEPEVLIPFSYNLGGTGENAFHNHSFGLVHNGASVTQACIARANNEGQATSANHTTLFSTRGAAQISNNTGATNWTCEFSNFDASGFSATARDGNSGGDSVGYLALDFNGELDISLDIIDSPTSTGNHSETSPGLQPEAVFQLLSRCAAVDTLEADADAGAFAVSMFDATSEYCAALNEEDNVGTTNTQNLPDNQAVNLPEDDGTTTNGFDATFVSMDTNGWTLNYASTDGTARKWIALSLGTIAAGGPTIPIFHHHYNQMKVQ